MSHVTCDVAATNRRELKVTLLVQLRAEWMSGDASFDSVLAGDLKRKE